MASPWTSSASDNLGQGANSTPCWVVVANTRNTGSYSMDDASGDNYWPALTPERQKNFDIVKGEVVIENQ